MNEEIPVDATIIESQPFSGLFGGLNVQQQIIEFENNRKKMFAKIPPEQIEEKQVWLNMVENIIDTVNSIFDRAGWKMENKTDSIAFFYSSLLNQLEYCVEVKHLQTIEEACNKVKITADWLAKHHYYSPIRSSERATNPILNAFEIGRQSFNEIEEHMVEKRKPAEFF